MIAKLSNKINHHKDVITIVLNKNSEEKNLKFIFQKVKKYLKLCNKVIIVTSTKNYFILS